jgi:hypothetical protein
MINAKNNPVIEQVEGTKMELQWKRKYWFYH